VRWLSAPLHGSKDLKSLRATLNRIGVDMPLEAVVIA
jgi:hypothetical protein